MHATFSSRTLAGLVVTAAAGALGSTGACAQDATAPSIYQQRNADGSITLTDRPASGAVTQRTWRTAPEDAGAAQRRESARQDAAEVSRRIGQRLDADDRRAHELTLARIRAAETQARLDADARQAAEAQPGWIVGPRVVRPIQPGGAGWNGGTPTMPTPVPTLPPSNARPPTAGIVRGIPLRSDGFPVR